MKNMGDRTPQGGIKMLTFIASTGKNVHIKKGDLKDFYPQDRSIRVYALCGMVGGCSAGDALKARLPTCDECLAKWASTYLREIAEEREAVEDAE